MTIMVPEEVYEGIEAIRRSGKTNMADISYVKRLAYEAEFYHTVVWLDENEEAYMDGIFKGIEPCQMVEGRDYLEDAEGVMEDG